MKSKNFVLNVKGSESKRSYEGLFEVKLNLSFRDQFKEDSIRRTMLGPGDGASTRVQTTAMALSQLAVRIIDGPSWWEESDGGLDLTDDNVIAELYSKLEETLSNAAKEEEEDLKKAKKELKDKIEQEKE